MLPTLSKIFGRFSRKSWPLIKKNFKPFGKDLKTEGYYFSGKGNTFYFETFCWSPSQMEIHAKKTHTVLMGAKFCPFLGSH
jgi:hypothetical protein